MADKITVVYDANVSDLNTKLDDLIKKNLALKGAVDEANKSLTAMGGVIQVQAKNIKIEIMNTQDYRTILNEVNKVVNDSRQIIKAATEATEKNTKAQNDNAQATERAGRARKAKTDAVVVQSKAVQDNSVKLTQNNTVHNNHSKTLDQSVKNVTNLNTKLVENNKTINDNSTNIKNVTDSYNRYVNGVAQASNSTNGFSGVLGQLQSRIIAVFSIQQLISFGESVVDVTRKTELMQNRLNFVFQNEASGEAAFNRLFEVAQKLGIGFQELSEGFVSFGIASRAAGFSAKTTEDIFVRVATALRAAGAGSLQTQRAFYALQQMLSKGVVAAEELRRQLGEALPGASDLMTKAYNRLHPAQQVTNLGFTKLLENGKIVSREILPEFSRVLEEEFAPALAGKAGSLDATLTRASNAWERFKLNIGQTNFQSISSGFKWLEERLTNINAILQNSENFWQSYYKIVNEVAYGSGLFTVSITDWWKGIMADEKEVAALNQRAFERGSLQYAEGIQNRKELAKMTKQEVQDRMKALKSEIDAKTEIAITDEAEAKRQRQRLRGYGMLIEQMQVFAEKENEESQKRNEADNSAKDAIKAREEALAKENLELEKLSENSVEYQKQLKRVYIATKNLEELKLAGSPQAFALAAFKLDQKIQEVDKRLGGFDPNVPETIVEPEVTLEPMRELDKEIRKIREDELELAVTTARKNVEITKEGTQERLDAEATLAIDIANLEVFKVKISTDSAKLKAEKVKLIEEKLWNELKKLGLDYVEDQKEIQDRVLDVIQDANDLIERNEGDSFQRRLARSNQMFEDMARKLREEMGNTEDFELLEALKKKLGEVEEAGKKAATQLTMSEVGKMISEIGDIYGEIANRQSVLYENEQNNLKKMLDDKLISEEEYNRRSLDLKKKQFNQEKQTAIIKAIIDGASAIMKSLITPWQIPLILGMTAAQISTISAQQFPGYKEGVIDLKGPGSETSDSITARLSRGESVMTADETRQYKPVLQAIRDGEFEAFVAKRYTSAMQRQDVALNTGGSFADNVSNSFDMQTAELATLLKQNRKVAIKNVDELAKAINRRGTAHKVIDRRTLR